MVRLPELRGFEHELPKTADVVIIGAGIQGASIAYNLAKLGVKDVVVLDKARLLTGSTGRCAAGIRAQWGSELNCKLGLASLERFENLEEELGYDIGLHQGGYLMIAYTQREYEQLKRNVELQNRLGINSEVLTHQDVKAMFPVIEVEDAVGFTYHARDGHADPFLTTIAYIEASRALGVKYFVYTEARAITLKSDRVTGVLTSRGYISTPVVVNAAGPYAREVGLMVGLDLPLKREVHEILITEPVVRILEPMLMSFSANFYMQQRPNGSFIMGMGPEKYAHPEDLDDITWTFPAIMARKAVKLVPVLKYVRILRQWAGYYTITPDRQPIISESSQVKGFFISAGYSGHGFMFAPISGEIVAYMITGKRHPIDVSKLNEQRFQRGELVIEPMVV